MRTIGDSLRLLSVVGLGLVSQAVAQTSTNTVPVLTTIGALPGQTPSGLLLGADGNFYGTTEFGGGSGAGTVFMASPSGVVKSLYSFSGGADGGNPSGLMVAGTGGNFYGTTSSGGNTSLDPSGAGTVFQVGTNGVLTAVYTFTGGNDGDTPLGGLSAGNDGAFYGTTLIGGDEGYGAAFRVTASGAFSNLGSFDYTQAGGSYQFPYGSSPASSLVQGGDGNFYGTSQAGGLAGLGGVFQLTPEGVFTSLFSFTQADGGSAQDTPGPQLVRAADGSFYGLTFYGGSYAAQDPAGLGYGTIFRVTTSGLFTEVYSFSGGADGANPVGALAQAPEGSFYGVAKNGGAKSFGTIFQLGTNGVVKSLYTFTGGSDGGNPPAGLTLGGDGNWYGVTAGTFYRLGYLTAPFITTQPASQTDAAGSTATFNVVVGGTTPLSYQWQFDGTDLPGATVATLVLTNVQAAQAGNYVVVLSNAAGMITSSNAVLSVYGPPEIATPPASQSAVAGSEVDLTVAVLGTGPFTYQWRYAGTNLQGEINGYLALPDIQLTQSGDYQVVVGNAAGSVTSAPATVAVTIALPLILSQPAGQVVGYGQSATLSVLALGGPPLAYQWQFGGQNIAGATNSQLALTNLQGSTAGNYDVVVSNPGGSVTSSIASISLTEAPVFSMNPSNQVVQTGMKVVLTAMAGGAGVISYRWQFDGTNLAGATNATLVLTNATLSDSGFFTVVASNFYGTVTSSPPALVLVDYNVYVLTLAGRNLSVSPYIQNPQGVAVDPAGNAYTADVRRSVIWKIGPDGGTSVLAGRLGLVGSTNGVGTNALFNAPAGVAVDTAGNVYVSDGGNNTIRKIAPGGLVTTLAGRTGFSGTLGGQGAAARFNLPTGLATDSSGNIYVADRGNSLIRKITPGGFVSTLAGKIGVPGYADGSATNARFSGPSGVALDAFGNIYVADTGNQVVRKIGTDGMVTTMAGAPHRASWLDGVATNTLFNAPQGVAVDKGGNIFVADSGNSVIRLISTNGFVTTPLGRPQMFGFRDGTGTNALFSDPVAVAFDLSGNLYVADWNNGAIRKGLLPGGVEPPVIVTQPQPTTGYVGSNAVFTVVAEGTGPFGFQWYFNGSQPLGNHPGPTLTLTDLQTYNAGNYSVVVTNLAGKATSKGASLKVLPPPASSEPITNVLFDHGVFQFSIRTQLSLHYILQYKNALTDRVWTSASTNAGGGGVIVIEESGVTNATRFYRVVIE